MAQLKIRDGTGKETVHELVDEVTSIGRASTNILQIFDEKASRQHFRIEKTGPNYKVVDLGSTNGTKLNGVKIQGEKILCPGDKISVGQTVMTFDGPGPAPEAAVEGGETVLSELTPDNSKSVPKFVLKVVEGAKSGHTYELGAEPLTMGRHSSNIIQLTDDAASNYHAEICREPMGYVLTDLGSTNGTHVKLKNKADFEKVVKTPLPAGAQIRIGKTVLAFENIGAPVEDEALFGTVALDPHKLEEKLSSPRKRGSLMPAVAALALFLLCATGYGVYSAMHRTTSIDTGPKPPPPPPDVNLIANGNFSEGTDDQGNPKHFKVDRAGVPGIRVAVVAEAQRPGKTDDEKMGLRIGVVGARSPATQPFVETSESVPVAPGKIYEYTAWMKHDGDGLYGLRVTWLQGDRAYSENPLVLKDTQEWKLKTVKLTAPSWAQRARVGVFVQGKEGSASFDDLSLKEIAGTAPPAPNVKFHSVALFFEGTKGAFTASSQGERMIEDGTLLLVNPDGTNADLASAIDSQAETGGDSVKYFGQLFDSVTQELANYQIQAQPGAAGVDLVAKMDLPSSANAGQWMRFFVVGSVAQGDIEITKTGDSHDQRVKSSENQSLCAVQGMLFNAGKMPQFNVDFDPPADVELTREGNRRKVTVKFKGEIRAAFASESLAQKRKMEAAAADLKKAADEKQWSDVETKAKALEQAFGSKFPQAGEEVKSAREKMESAWKSAETEIKKVVGALQEDYQNAAAARLAEETLARLIVAWKGSEKEASLQETQKLIAVLRSKGQDAEMEKKADAELQRAQKMIDAKVYSVALSILKKSILEQYPKSKAAQAAQTLIPEVEKKNDRKEQLQAIQDRLRQKVKNFLIAKDLDGAEEAIKKDKEYLENKDELPPIKELLKD